MALPASPAPSPLGNPSPLSLVLVQCAFRRKCQWESRDKRELQMRHFNFDMVPFSNGAAFWSILLYDGMALGQLHSWVCIPGVLYLSWADWATCAMGRSMWTGSSWQICSYALDGKCGREIWVCVPLSTERRWGFFLPVQLCVQWISESQTDIPADQIICPVLE